MESLVAQYTLTHSGSFSNVSIRVHVRVRCLVQIVFIGICSYFRYFLGHYIDIEYDLPSKTEVALSRQR